MNQSGWRSLTIALGATLAVLLGISAVVVLLPGTGTPGPTSTAFASGVPSASPGSSGPAGSSSPSPGSSASPKLSPSPSPSPSLTPALAPAASIVFRQMRLDLGTDPMGTARTLTFLSDGPATVTARVSNSSTLTRTHLCVAVTGRAPVCHDGATGSVTRRVSSGHVSWTVTLTGIGITTPTVDLTLTFRADHPSVKLTGFRFDGTSQAGNNGFIARMRPRAGGNLSVSASWGAKPFDYSLELADLTKGSPALNHPGTGIGVQASLPVTAADLWQVSLANAEDPGLGRISLSATLSWP
jgi:hypothetical protein